MRYDKNWENLYFPDFTPYAALDPEIGLDLVSADPFAPDGSIPDFIKEELKSAIDRNLLHYIDGESTKELYPALKKKLKEYNRLDVNPDTEILLTPGSAFGLFLAIRICINPNSDEEVINFDPSFAENLNNVIMMGAKNVFYTTKEDDNYQFDVEALECLVTPKTRCVVLTHPNNPTGTVYTKENLQRLAKFIKKHNLMLIVDQCFERNIYDGTEYVTIATLPGMRDHTITVFGPSKDMGLTGVRIGYLVAPKEFISKMHLATANYVGTINSFVPPALAAAYNNPSYVDEWNRIFSYRRKKASKILNQVPNVHCNLPQAGFCLWLDVRKLGATSKQILTYLVEHAQVAVGDGAWFGKKGEGFLRIMFCRYKNDEVFFEAIDRIASGLRKYQGLAQED